MENIEIFRDIHKGEIGFVIAPGPSLARWDINKIIKKGISFCCSSALLGVDNCDYFLLVDGIIPYLKYYDKVGIKSKNVIFGGGGFATRPEYKFNINGYGDKIPFEAKKYLIDRRYDDPSNLDFNKRDGKLICSYDVVMGAVHLACVCGCDPIITIGLDLVWENGQRYFKKLEGDMIQRKNSPYKYSDDLEEYRKMDNTETDGFNRSYRDWVTIKSINPTLNIKNTNPKGRMSDLYETINLIEYEKD